jgi:hypothetical protein
MSQIYLLGREDREGLARILSGEIGRLMYDEEVFGWNRPYIPDEMPTLRIELYAEEDPAFDKVFTSEVMPCDIDPQEMWETIKKLEAEYVEETPTVCHKIRWTQ